MKKQSQIFHLLLSVVVLFLLSAASSVYSQDTLTIQGIILDPAGKPVSNVSVGVEGSSELPEFSNNEGVFTLKVTPEAKWLIVEPPLFKSKRIYINKRENLKIYLTKLDMPSGDDEVTIVNQEITKRNIVASFSSVAGAGATKSGAITLDQYFQGKIPGFHVTNSSGLAGSGTYSMLNGPNSLYLSNEPMYIIDGVMVSSAGVFNSMLDGYEYNPLLELNVMNVSVATIAKDPSVTSAYGSRGSNGIVMIKTLDPSATQTLIELDMRTGFYQAPERTIPQLDAYQHKALMSEVLFSSGMMEEYIMEAYPGLFVTPGDPDFINYQHNTNWQNLIFNDAPFSNITFKVKGGDEIARYGLSLGYLDSKGVIKSTGYNGYNLRFISLVNILPWLKMSAGVSLNYSKYNLKESARIRQTSPIFTALSKSPMLNPYGYDTEGRELATFSLVDEFGVSNPLAVIKNLEARNSNISFTPTLGASALISKDLELHTNFSFTYNILEEIIFLPSTGMELYYNEEAINESKVSNNSFKSFNNNTYLNYHKRFGDHSFQSSTGLNNQMNSYEFDNALTRNAPSNDQYRTLSDGVSDLRELAGENRYWNWLSLYENLNYSYRDKYLFTGSVSLDGSTRIGDNARNTIKINTIPFGLFYGGGFGWRISNEPFLKNLTWLEELKLRVSFGKTGNDDFGEATATRYYSSIKYRGAVGLYPAIMYNEELTYETVNKLTTGMDLALWGNRFTLNADFYSSETNNMFIYRDIDPYFGYSFRPENGGRMKNKGVDLGMYFRIIHTTNFKWDIEGTFSKLKNEITEISGGTNLTELMGAEIINKPGEQANSFYGYVFNGVYSTTAEAENANLLNDKFLPFQAGDAQYSDLSGPEGTPDGIINDFDKVIIGSPIPDIFGGFGTSIIFKQITLSGYFQFNKGNEVFNFIRYKNESMSGLENQSLRVLNRWQYEGQITDVPRAKWKDPMGNSAFSTRWIEDGSYLRLKNISLSYSIDKRFLSFRNAEFYISANNVFTWTKYLGYDPEFSFSGSLLGQGIDYGMMPQTRQFILGAKIGF